MPTKTYKRIFCTHCQNYELFYKALGEDASKCQTCSNDFVPYYDADVPKEKLLEQRERYKEYKSKQFNSVMGMLSSYSLGQSSPNVEVDEDDAGYEDILKERNRQYEEKRKHKQEQQEMYKDAERNKPCLCGSGQKYKKCCYIRIKSL